MPVLYDPSQVAILAIFAAASMTHDSQPTKLALTGEPTRIARPAVFYAFSPTLVQSGAADSRLTFTIENKPAWASFGRRHGTLYGVPHANDAGTYPDIRITVTDGKIVADLKAFTLEVPAVSARR
jgi:hypothetical protein